MEGKLKHYRAGYLTGKKDSKKKLLKVLKKLKAENENSSRTKEMQQVYLDALVDVLIELNEKGVSNE